MEEIEFWFALFVLFEDVLLNDVVLTVFLLLEERGFRDVFTVSLLIDLFVLFALLVVWEDESEFVELETFGGSGGNPNGFRFCKNASFLLSTSCVLVLGFSFRYWTIALIYLLKRDLSFITIL